MAILSKHYLQIQADNLYEDIYDQVNNIVSIQTFEISRNSKIYVNSEKKNRNLQFIFDYNY